jgi:hypothetical protein
VDFYRVQITPALVNVPKRIVTNELVIFDLPPSSSFVIGKGLNLNLHQNISINFYLFFCYFE